MTEEQDIKPTNPEKKTVTQALATLPASGGAVVPIVPKTFEDAYRIAKVAVVSGFVPYGIKTAEEAVIVIMHGLEVGLTPMVALQSICLINNRPALYGDGALAVVRNSGLLEKITEKLEGEGEAMTAVCTVKRVGQAPVKRTFSKQDAVTAGLWGKRGRDNQPTPWVTYPKRMLQMRARAFALRDVFPDKLRGMGIREEVEDIPQTENYVAPPPPPMVLPPSPLEEAISNAQGAELAAHAGDVALEELDNR